MALTGATTTMNNQTEIFGRAIDLHPDQLSPDVAQFIVSIDLTQDDESRMNELAEKARLDSLGQEDEIELEEYL